MTEIILYQISLNIKGISSKSLFLDLLEKVAYGFPQDIHHATSWIDSPFYYSI
jgi:hypothetical protein